MLPFEEKLIREVSLSEVNDLFEGMSKFAHTGTFVVPKFA